MRRWRLLPGWIPGDILSSTSQPRAVSQHSSMPRGGHSNSPTRAGSEAAPLRRALLARAGARQMLALFTNPSARDFLVHKHSQMEKNIHTEGICRSMVGPRHRLTVFFSKSLLHLFLNFPPLLPICFLHTHFLCCTFSDFCGDHQHLWITCKICKKHSLKN